MIFKSLMYYEAFGLIGQNGYPNLMGVSPKLIGVWNWGLCEIIQS